MDFRANFAKNLYIPITIQTKEITTVKEFCICILIIIKICALIFSNNYFNNHILIIIFNFILFYDLIIFKELLIINNN